MPPEETRARRARSRRPPKREAGSEAIDLRTSDGWSLRADGHEPPAEPVGTAVLAHAMMARRSSFDRPEGRGVAAHLIERGWRVVNFDFRGHGDSAPRVQDGASF